MSYLGELQSKLLRTIHIQEAWSSSEDKDTSVCMTFSPCGDYLAVGLEPGRVGVRSCNCLQAHLLHLHLHLPMHSPYSWYAKPMMRTIIVCQIPVQDHDGTFHLR